MNLETDKFLHDLACRLPGITKAQALKGYFDQNYGRMHRILRAYQDKGLIKVTTEFVRERNIADSPIATVRPGDSTIPSSHHIAYAASQRWSDVVNSVLVIRGTAKLATIFGGETRTFVAGHVSHEIALTSLFLRKRGFNPDFTWELVQAKPGNGVLPDAVSAGVAFELVGMYSGGKVAGKLEITATTPLELW